MHQYFVQMELYTVDRKDDLLREAAEERLVNRATGRGRPSGPGLAGRALYLVRKLRTMLPHGVPGEIVGNRALPRLDARQPLPRPQ